MSVLSGVIVAEPFIKQLQLTNFLSFGPASSAIELRALNLLIGPNGTGKTNLVEAIAVLQAAPGDLAAPIRSGGGVAEWLHRGDSVATEAKIEVTFEGAAIARARIHRSCLRYLLAFGHENGAFVVRSERIDDDENDPLLEMSANYFVGQSGHADATAADGRRLTLGDYRHTQSIFSQRRDPENYPEITQLADKLGRIAIYRKWTFGPDAPMRQSSRIDSRSDRLNESLDNLSVRIAALCRDPAVKRSLVSRIADVAPGFSDIVVAPEGGRLQLYLTEGQHNVAAQRLSDGTLRYLVLLAILLDPNPPPLVVIEEPELGLHFDLVAKVADLLREASKRMQLIVTTHSEALIDAFSDEPEVVLVCEKHEGSTQLKRLNGDDLAEWLKAYSLGTLWGRGEIGGTRW
jgi:predicted ATPase